MLSQSRLYSFIDPSKFYSLHFLEAQKIIQDEAITKNLKGSGFSFYRDLILSSMHLVNFLKIGEQIGLYIDSKDPKFSFKLELNYKGLFRTLILPTDFQNLPDKVTGLVRIIKAFPGNEKNYQSIVPLEDTPTNQIMNLILRQSYQTKAMIYLPKSSDQSFMIRSLPGLKGETSSTSLEQFLNLHKKNFEETSSLAMNDFEKIVDKFKQDSFEYLSSEQITFQCSCSKERFMKNLILLNEHDIKDAFGDKEHITVDCDYCRQTYQILKTDLA